MIRRRDQEWTETIDFQEKKKCEDKCERKSVKISNGLILII